MAMQQTFEAKKGGQYRRKGVEAQAAHAEAMRLLEAGQYARAREQARHALAVREAMPEATPLELADSLNLLGMLCHLQGDYAQAELLLQRGFRLRETDLGTQDHPEVADSLNNLANLYADRGDYTRAELLYQQSLAIREAALEQGHPQIADSLNNLARLFARRGLYKRAEPLYTRALAHREAALGHDHPDVARTLNNLANLYRDQGLHTRAEPLYQRALAIREAALGGGHPLVATSLNNLASLYRDQAMYGRAEPLYERALVICETALGANHPQVARTLNNLAELHAARGEYEQAETLSGRALVMREVALGSQHPDIAYSLTCLACCLHGRGEYELAEPLYERALAIREAAWGDSHPLISEALYNLAHLWLAQERLDEALPLLWRAFTMSEQRLRQEALEFSTARLASFLQFLRASEERLYALLRAHPDDTRVQRLALTAVLLLKGRALDEAADTSQAIYQSLCARDCADFERLRELRAQLSALANQGSRWQFPADYQQRLQSLADQGDAIEAELARRSAPLRARAALPSAEHIVDQVAAALPRDGALIELVAYLDHPLWPRPSTSESRDAARFRYLALILFPDASIRVVELGWAEPIDQAASRLRNALANRDAAFLAGSQELYERAFRPLQALLGETRRLFLSTDGQLSLVPFAALHDGRQFLLDSFDFIYLTSGKELLPRVEDTPASDSVVVLADPDFSASGQADSYTPGESLAVGGSSPLNVAELPCVPLPGTRREAEAIQRMMPQAQLFLGAEATKERLLSLPTPGVLHLATHGFFLGDTTPALEGQRAIAHFGALGTDTSAPRPSDPLLRSGLALAHSHSGSTDGSSRHSDNCWVTALELAGLNLWGTQLVVISACDTGRGEVKLGQGVYGLRRALVTAGAETVVTSLWKVNDETTQTLMEAYYRHLLKGQGRCSALHTAMRLVRLSHPHPHHWAPFIAVGRDAPLSMAAAMLPEPELAAVA
jgi:CHAT domain-containing protein/Tfp pilus assembly protein PilF